MNNKVSIKCIKALEGYDCNKRMNPLAKASMAPTNQGRDVSVEIFMSEIKFK